MSTLTSVFRRRLRVVLVDDEPSHLVLWRSILEFAGYDVLCFEDPTRALEAIAEGCDCVITDYQMPQMNGAELIRAAARSDGPAFILLTGDDSPVVARQALDAGASCVLTKPARLAAITAAVEWLCGGRTGEVDQPFLGAGAWGMIRAS